MHVSTYALDLGHCGGTRSGVIPRLGWSALDQEEGNSTESSRSTSTLTCATSRSSSRCAVEVLSWLRDTKSLWIYLTENCDTRADRDRAEKVKLRRYLYLPADLEHFVLANQVLLLFNLELKKSLCS
jgi:hypothetical protein